MSPPAPMRLRLPLAGDFADRRARGGDRVVRRRARRTHLLELRPRERPLPVSGTYRFATVPGLGGCPAAIDTVPEGDLTYRLDVRLPDCGRSWRTLPALVGTADDPTVARPAGRTAEPGVSLPRPHAPDRAIRHDLRSLRRADLARARRSPTPGRAASRRWAHVNCPPGCSISRVRLNRHSGARRRLEVWTDGACSATWTMVGLGDQGRPAGLGRAAAHHEPADGDPGRAGGGTRWRAAGGGQRLHTTWSTASATGGGVAGWLAAPRSRWPTDLWEPLVAEIRSRGDITFRWVKGTRRPDERPGGPAGGRGRADRALNQWRVRHQPERRPWITSRGLVSR